MFHCTEHGASNPYASHCEACEGFDPEPPTPEEIRTAAYDAGTEAGTAQASWLIDGNTTTETAHAILEAFDACDFDFPAPLSGEYAGESIPEIIHDAGLDYDLLNTGEIHDHNDVDTFLDAYETAFFAAYEAEAVRAARYQVEG